MAKRMYEENDIIDIANAIRAKNGTSGDANPPKYTTAQMADAIRAISTTGAGDAETINGWHVNVIDDGTEPSDDILPNTISFVYTKG